MAQATDYEQGVRNVLENAVQRAEGFTVPIGIDESDIRPGLDRICTRLHDHDGWADWREIYASVYEAAVNVCSHRRRPIWATARQAVQEWGSGHAVNTEYARV